MTPIRLTPEHCPKAMAIAIAALTLIGCREATNTASPEPAVGIGVKTAFQGQHCGAETAGLDTVARETFHSITHPQVPPGLSGQTSEPPPPPAGALYRISLGQKNTGGYGVALASTPSKIENDTLWIAVDTVEPAPDSVNTMVVTRPCLILAVQDGQYDAVAVSGKPQWRVARAPSP